jgi:hypothetical protein
MQLSAKTDPRLISMQLTGLQFDNLLDVRRKLLAGFLPPGYQRAFGHLTPT